MTLVVAAPVANRAWALDDWFANLARQTRTPDAVYLLHGGVVGDDTWQTARSAAKNVGLQLHLMHDHKGRIHPRHDPERFHTLVDLRNMLKAWVRLTANPTYYMSLDTDIMLEDPATIAKLIALLNSDYADPPAMVAPVTWLHPAGKGSWALNAGFWSPDGTPGDPHRRWVRVEQTHFDECVKLNLPLRVDMPWAVWLARMDAIAQAQYRWHESCEDLGFAHDLERLGVRVWWDPRIETRHVWQASDL